jgi:PAS domain S-box-containing protein
MQCSQGKEEVVEVMRMTGEADPDKISRPEAYQITLPSDAAAIVFDGSRAVLYFPKGGRVPENAALAEAVWQRLKSEEWRRWIAGEETGQHPRTMLTSRAEEAARESEARFRRVFKHAASGIAIKDLEGRFQACNPAYASMLGYTEDELCAFACEDLMHPDDRASNLAAQKRLIACEIPSFESVTRYFKKGGGILWAQRQVSLLQDDAGRPAGIIVLLTDMTGHKRHEEQISLLMGEVNHRAKNMLTVVQSIARQTVATKPEDFIERFGERIGALAANHDLLVKNGWRGVDLGELVCSQLAHFKDLIGTRIDLKGPQVMLAAPAAQTIGMALHELATNAGKYGALSNGAGRVEIGWGLDCTEASQEIFTMSWHESGGPSVTAPEKPGFGSAIIGTVAEASLSAKVELAFAASGLSWSLHCPASEAVESSGPGLQGS